MGVHRQLPHLGNAGRGVHRLVGDLDHHYAVLPHLMRQLQARLRRVRVCCGDWTRVLGSSPTIHNGLTAVFLDPPYAPQERRGNLYAIDRAVSDAVREWAIAHGDNPLLRIALCGYAEEHAMPPNWELVRWKTRGGYGNQSQGRGRQNAVREAIWFSPHCLKPQQYEQQFDLLLT
jgi:hypothetical protein